MKEVVLDTETTGISTKEGHRIVEIGCIELENLIPTKNKFHCYLNPERKVSEKAIEVHGYTDEFLATKEKFINIVEQFLKLNNEIVDTLILARDKFPGSPVSLDALCKRYRVDNSKRTQHTALIDCDLLAKVYVNLLDQKEPSLNFQNQEDDAGEKRNLNVSYFKKVIRPTDTEIKKHKEYLKTYLKKNYY